MRKCAGCDTQFEIGPRERNKRKWCSTTCRRRSYFKANPEKKREAAAKQAERQSKAYVPTAYSLTCRMCSADFVASRPDQMYCGKPCQYRSVHLARRARRRGVERAVYYPTEVGERDGWACGICREPVDMEISYPDPMSRSIDHIVPISKGGGDTPENVQLAHLSCNIAKSDHLDFTVSHSGREALTS